MNESPIALVSDPCQVRVKRDGRMEACGVIRESLYGHLKAHKRSNGKNWSVAEYQKAYPKSSLGKKPVATAEALANLKRVPKADEPQAESPPPSFAEYEERLQARFAEIWDQIGRDTSMRAFALEAARCEMRLQDLNREYDELALKPKRDIKGDASRLNALLDQISTQQTMLQKNMTFLGQSAKDRKEKNQLGSDTCAQLISNWAGTLRRMSPEKREIFKNRSREVQAVWRERTRETIIAEALGGPVEVVEATDERDLKSELLAICATV